MGGVSVTTGRAVSEKNASVQTAFLGPEREKGDRSKGVSVMAESKVSAVSETAMSGREWTESPVVARRRQDGRYQVEEPEAFLCGGGSRGGREDEKFLSGRPRAAWGGVREREACLTPMKVREEGAIEYDYLFRTVVFSFVFFVCE